MSPSVFACCEGAIHHDERVQKVLDRTDYVAESSRVIRAGAPVQQPIQIGLFALVVRLREQVQRTNCRGIQPHELLQVVWLHLEI
eukprot:SAG31_NODE_430_length_15792_cov_15.908558_4_plen_85_part_00